MQPRPTSVSPQHTCAGRHVHLHMPVQLWMVSPQVAHGDLCSPIMRHPEFTLRMQCCKL